MRILISVVSEMTKAERINARAVNLIMALTGFAMFAIGLYRMTVSDIKAGAAVVLCTCLLQTVLWEDNYDA